MKRRDLFKAAASIATGLTTGVWVMPRAQGGEKWDIGAYERTWPGYPIIRWDTHYTSSATVFDGNGQEIRRIEWINVETGELQRISDPVEIVNDAIVRIRESCKLPVRVVFRKKPTRKGALRINHA